MPLQLQRVAEDQGNAGMVHRGQNAPTCISSNRRLSLWFLISEFYRQEQHSVLTCYCCKCVYRERKQTRDDGEGRVFGIGKLFQDFHSVLLGSLRAIMGSAINAETINQEFSHQTLIKQEWMLHRELVCIDPQDPTSIDWDSCQNQKMKGQCSLTILEASMYLAIQQWSC